MATKGNATQCQREENSQVRIRDKTNINAQTRLYHTQKQNRGNRTKEATVKRNPEKTSADK